RGREAHQCYLHQARPGRRRPDASPRARGADVPQRRGLTRSCQPPGVVRLARFRGCQRVPTVAGMTTTQPRRGRVIALRVVAAIFVLIILIALNVTMILPWIAWLPERTLLSIGMSQEDVPAWLVQGTAIQLDFAILLVCVALQLRRPAANVAALWLVIAFL